MSVGSIRQQIEKVEDRLRAQALESACALLPNLEENSLARAAQWTGLDFLRDSILEHIEREEKEIALRQRELEQHPDFKLDIREVYAEVEAEKRRLEEHQRSLKPLIATCNGHPRFAQLVRDGYGTSRYKTPFWRFSYHSDRQAARELCKRTGKATFAALLEEYYAAGESLGVLQERIKHVDQIPRRTPKKEWQQLEERKLGLEKLHLGTARSRIQLALLRQGPIWKSLKQAKMPQELVRSLEATGLLLDQLEELRRHR